MKLMGKRILIEQHMSEKMTEGGLALPDASIQALPRGKVLQKGPDVSSKSGLITGDIVQFDAYAAVHVETKVGKFILIEEDDVLLILEEGE